MKEKKLNGNKIVYVNIANASPNTD